MSKHRAESAAPLPTLATSLAPPAFPPPAAPRPGVGDEAALFEPVIAPPALNLPAGNSPIPAPVLTTPRRSQVDIATPVSVIVACWTAIVMCVAHFVSYTAIAIQLSSARGSHSNSDQITNLIPGQSGEVSGSGTLTLLTLVAFCIAIFSLVVAGLAGLALKRSSGARTALIICAGGTAAVSLGPVFGNGSAWWLLTMLTAVATAGIMGWNGWWFVDSHKLRR